MDEEGAANGGGYFDQTQISVRAGRRRVDDGADELAKQLCDRVGRANLDPWQMGDITGVSQ